MVQLMYRNPDTKEYEKLSIEPLDCYPVGSFYISYNNTSPADMFGGTWTQVTSRFLYATTSTATGGSASHKHYVPIFMSRPDYDTGQVRLISWRGGDFNPIHGFYTSSNTLAMEVMLHYTANRSIVDGNMNSNPAHSMYSQTVSSLPPYQGVYCWYRTA